MLSPPHEAMHRIFQHDPGLFSRVAPLLGIAVPTIVETTVLPSAIDTNSPAGCRRNTQLHLETAGRGSFLLLIEAQDRRASRRPAHWAHHVPYLWTQHQLPTALLIMCSDQETAQWAGQPVSSGPVQPPALTLRPFVASPNNLPLITDLEEARADPALAALSAVMHPAAPLIGSALEALSASLRDVPDLLAYPLTGLTELGLRLHPARHAWSDLMRPIIRRKSHERARIERITRTRREDLLLILAERGLILPEDARRRITWCLDPESLRHWLLRSVTASSVEEIFDD
ncbi:hypothetical protein [Streptomyces sp. B3I8]|uniref:hypothetical protein n=1 Tax=Streptomyces sp. B3I8 TaxID=3042303 RepID=UPI002787A805|nr:hypothetical protein [Streptomyces sp. B3I8]MDQ0788592.1 hypothetical protein [Streptomyces sp. B3I8]